MPYRNWLERFILFCPFDGLYQQLQSRLLFVCFLEKAKLNRLDKFVLMVSITTYGQRIARTGGASSESSNK